MNAGGNIGVVLARLARGIPNRRDTAASNQWKSTPSAPATFGNQGSDLMECSQFSIARENRISFWIPTGHRGKSLGLTGEHSQDLLLQTLFIVGNERQGSFRELPHGQLAYGVIEPVSPFHGRSPLAVRGQELIPLWEKGTRHSLEPERQGQPSPHPTARDCTWV